MMAAALKILSAIPGWVYAAIIVLAVVLGIGAHLVIQRNDARKDLATARARITELERDNATLAGNAARLESSLKEQGKSIERAAEAAKRAQAQADADLKIATQRLRDAEARNVAMRAIQESGDRSKGGDYAHDVRRARLLRP